MNAAQPAAGVRLCPLGDIPDPGAKTFLFRDGDYMFVGFVVRKAGGLFGYIDRCPHNGTPLAMFPDRYFTRERDLLLCSTHGALFRVGDGRCIAGPCEGRALAPWPVTIVDGAVLTA